jgi:hypothetical protein
MTLHLFITMATDMQRFSEAAALHDAVMKVKDSPLGRYLLEPLAHAIHMSGNYRKELSVWDAAVALMPRTSDPCLGRIQALIALERLANLPRQIDTCLALNGPDHARMRVEAYSKFAGEVRRHTRNVALVQLLRDTAAAVIRREHANGRRSNGVTGAYLAELGFVKDAVELFTRSRDNGERLIPLNAGLAVASAVAVGDTSLGNYFRQQLGSNPRPRLIAEARIALAEGRHDEALHKLGEFAQRGGRVIQQLYHDGSWSPLWGRVEWQQLFAPK